MCVDRFLGLRAFLVLSLLSPGAVAIAQAPPPPQHWYLAEGSTQGTPNWTFDLYVLVANPNPEPVDARITFLLPAGTTPVPPRTYTLPAASRLTVNVNSIPGLELKAVSTVVDCYATGTNNPCPAGYGLVVERTMYWPRGGWKADGSGWLGGHNSLGVTETRSEWYLAEGSSGFFDNFILLANPDTSRVATAQLTLYREDGYTKTITRSLAPESRTNVWVGKEGPETAEFLNKSFSVSISSDIPIAVERSMYWGRMHPNDTVQGVDWKGGHESAAAPSPATEWNFAEGFTGSHPSIGVFETYLLVMNPQRQSVRITGTYFRDSGGPLQWSCDVQPQSRFTLQVQTGLYGNSGPEPVSPCSPAPPAIPETAFATRITSTAPILAERAVYWGPPGQWVEGHNTPGITAQAPAWGFAEGSAEPGANTFFLIQNSSSTDITLKITYMREDGKGVVKTQVVPKNSRRNVDSPLPWLIPGLAGRRFATFIESTTEVDGQKVPFIAERAMYWGSAFTIGHASAGHPWTGTVATPATIVPVIGSVSPTSGSVAGGTAITISGSDFFAGATVTVGGTAATNVVVVDSQTITARTPAGTLGAADVVVRNTDTQQATLAGGFTYIRPAPTVTAISPTSCLAATGCSVTITGTNFLSGATVTVGGATATVSSVSATSIAAVAPAHAPGIVSVVVTNTDSQAATLPNAFTYLSPPSISTVTPSAGPTGGGTEVSITGSNFRWPISVSFAGVAAPWVDMPNASLVKARTPRYPISSGTQAVSVTVTNADGSSVTASAAFTYRLPANVLAYGDSITYGITSWEVPITPTNLAGIERGTSETPYPTVLQASLRTRYGDAVIVTNAGQPGDLASQWMGRLPGLLTGRELAVIMIGTNDANGGPETPGQIAGHIGNAVQAAKDAGKDVILLNLVPASNEGTNSRIDEVNLSLVSIAAAKRVALVDVNAAFGPPGSPSFNRYMSPDGLHPSSDGYQLISNLVFNRIVEMYPK